MRLPHITFDIETGPDPEAIGLIERPEAPKNYTDPEKIAAYIEAKHEENRKNAALDPHLCIVTAIGWQAEGHEIQAGTIGDGSSEAELIEWFWAEALDHHLVGFNVIGFDLPVLLTRSMYLGIETPRLSVNKYRHDGVTDLLQQLSCDWTKPFHKLTFHARRFGIELPSDEITGAEVGQAIQDGRWDLVEQHVRADVAITTAVAARMGHFDPAGPIEKLTRSVTGKERVWQPTFT